MAKLFANSGDPDQAPQNHSVASDQCLQCLSNYPLGVSRLKWVNSSGLGFDIVVVFVFSCVLASERHQVLCFVCLFVCVEVLQPRQPNGVMSSAASLPNHTFTGQA